MLPSHNSCLTANVNGPAVKLVFCTAASMSGHSLSEAHESLEAEFEIWKSERSPIERRVRLLQSIDRDVPAIDPVCARRRDEGDNVGHFLGGAEPAHRKAVANVIVEIAGVGEA